MSSRPDNRNCIRQRVEVRGIVQGVGFRPYVYALAQALGLAGFVRNHSSGVTLEIQGTPAQLQQFLGRLPREAPPLSRLEELLLFDADVVAGQTAFLILESRSAAECSTPVSPDMATCDACLAELNDPADRRYRYPFINCTDCGPRYTIIRDIPYDRPLTSMQPFVMCGRCQSEYDDPGCRRFHAQPNACPDCGPAIWFDVPGDRVACQRPAGDSPLPVGERALQAFHAAVARGQIVAVKGIGGFHLACDAGNDEAVEKLRGRKGRAEKPLAVLVGSLQDARKIALVQPAEERLLASGSRPIVLVQRRSDAPLSSRVAPGQDRIGVMLPYSPLHHLLAGRVPLVMTSGNRSEEPIARTNQEAVARLSSLVDGFLLHDREIHVVCDDSVLRVAGDRPLPIRRSRGYAPLPVRLPVEAPELLAVGGELKATFCLTKGRQAYLSPHIGDMANLETLEAFGRSVEHLARLFRVVPRRIACDLHPGYLSTRWARQYAAERRVEVVAVQHHHAHVAAVLAEHGVAAEQEVIGVSLDGTGYGTDGAIWGGEILLASARGFRRWGHLRYVPLPGGDASVRFPFRAALAHLWSAGIAWDPRLPGVAHCPPDQRTVIRRQLERNLNCFRTSSLGRLFDAVASLTGVGQSNSYEAQAAMQMEALSDDLSGTEAYEFTIRQETPRQIDPSGVLQCVVRDVLQGRRTGAILARFHLGVARMIFASCQQARDETGLNHVVLSGGVFQNARLLECVRSGLLDRGFHVLQHQLVPPNDGGLALGQAYVAAALPDSIAPTSFDQTSQNPCTNSP